jgi:hypothetical protein
MPRSFRCLRGQGERHEFVEGTPAYIDMMNFPANKNMNFPFWCPFDRSGLIEGEEAEGDVVGLPSLDTQYALLLVVADVSGSMFEVAATGTKTKIEQVTESLTEVLRDLALPSAGTANSLLVGVIVFATRALWVDLSGEKTDFGSAPQLLTASELAGKLVGANSTIGSDRARECDAIRASLTGIFGMASQFTGPGGTDYDGAIRLCAGLLGDVQSAERRKALRPDWDQIYPDSAGRTFLRTFFYSDGAPTHQRSGDPGLVALCREVFPNDNLPLITSSFANADEHRERAEALLKGMSSTCPVHREEHCTFPASEARRFREIIRMASGGSGFCVRCLRER